MTMIIDFLPCACSLQKSSGRSMGRPRGPWSPLRLARFRVVKARPSPRNALVGRIIKQDVIRAECSKGSAGTLRRQRAWPMAGDL